MENENIYTTRDLAEASALIVNKQTLLNIERKGSICWFIFDNTGNCQTLSNQFFFGTLLVNAREYYDAMTRLKNRIFAK